MSENLFKVFKSSAGSGKTFALVKEYLKFCLRTDNAFYFSKILAITFTNKASGEMKDRLINTLKKAVDKESVLSEPLLKESWKELGIDIEVFIGRSKKMLSALLHSYGDLSISTIDKFMLKVIRSFSRDLKLPLNFDVEMQQSRLLERVISKLLSEIGQDAEADKIVFDFAKWKIQEGKSWKLERDLHTSASTLYLEGSDKQLHELKDLTYSAYIELIMIYVKDNQIFKHKLAELGQKGVQLMKENQLSEAHFSGGSKGGYATYFIKLAEGQILPLNKTQEKAIVHEKLYASSLKDQKELIISLTPSFLQINQEIADFINTEMKLYYERKLFLENLPAQSLLGKIDAEIERIKKEEKLINISDFNRLISAIVLTEYVPFIYERIGERYNHIMVDEFQDTSVLQFQNLLPLIDESLSKGFENMIVGDAKQSIYRFRGAVVEQFSQMPFIELVAYQDELNQERLDSLQRNFSPEPLNTNWRSSAEIITFNNDFFEQICQMEEVAERNKLIFDGHKQEVPENASKEGYIEVRKLEGKNSSEKEVANFAAIDDIIQSLLAKNYDYSDIAILCMKNDQLSSIARYLSDQNIPIISAEALKLSHSSAVNFMIDLLKWNLNQKNNEAELAVFNFLYDFHGKLWSKEELQFDFLSKEGKGLKQFLKDHHLPLPSYQQSHENLLQFFEKQIRLFHLDRTYDPYLQFFQEYVFEFVQRQKGSVNDFLQQWEVDQEKLSVELRNKGNAIQLSTIHASKGLEFPMVIMPFADYRISSNKGFLWTDELPSPATDLQINKGLLSIKKELSGTRYAGAYEEEMIRRQGDMLNNVYVGFTRAEKGLYLLSEEPAKTGDSFTFPLILNRFLSKMEEGDGCHYRGQIVEKNESKSEKESEEESITLQHYHSSAWNSKVNLSLEMRTQWEEETTNELDSRTYGSLVHEILSKIYSIEDSALVLNDFTLQGKVNSEVRIEIKAQINELFAKEEVRRFFNPQWKIANERSFLAENGEVLRPDRLVESETELMILDYKSGEKRDSHVDQLKRYATELAKLSTKKVSAYLLYLQDGELMQVA